MGFPGGSDGKESACNTRDLSWIPGSGRLPEEGNGNPLQYSCLENPMDGGAWRAIVRRVAKSQTQFTDFTFTFMYTYICMYVCTHTYICVCVCICVGICVYIHISIYLSIYIYGPRLIMV